MRRDDLSVQADYQYLSDIVEAADHIAEFIGACPH